MALIHRVPARSARAGAMPVRRVLPSRLQRKVGPWVFLDHFGPVTGVVDPSHDVYAVAHLRAGQRLALPDHEERCAYAVSGSFAIDGDAAATHELLIVDRSAGALVASEDATVAILGGRAIGPRHIWWNLVHSDPSRLREQATRWRERRFPTIPGDDEEFVPAPEFGP